MIEVQDIDPRVDTALYAGELELRFAVLREPIGLTRGDVPQPGELDWLHVIARDGDAVIGCVLLAIATPPEREPARLRQMAVALDHHRRGVGRALVAALEAAAIARGVRAIAMHARGNAVPFYARLGYAVTGDPFTEVGIPHRIMERTLRSR